MTNQDSEKQRTTRVERELSKFLAELDRYELIIKYYTFNPKRISPNKEYLEKMCEPILGISPGLLIDRFGIYFGARIIELGPSIPSMQKDLSRLLSNAERDSKSQDFSELSADYQAQMTTQGGNK